MESDNNLLLTGREGRTGEYWPEVVTVRTKRGEVRTKTTEGQYSPVRPEQARLVSSLLYGTLFLIVKCTSGGLHLKNVCLLHPSLKFESVTKAPTHCVMNEESFRFQSMLGTKSLSVFVCSFRVICSLEHWALVLCVPRPA